METNLQIIRAACIVANPAIVQTTYMDEPYTGPIRLADVLLAAAQANRVFDLIALEIVRLWDLIHDDLTLQSPETLEFLANLFK